MKDITKEVLGFAVPFRAYESVKEADAAGGEGTSLRLVNDQLIRMQSLAATKAVVGVLRQLSGLPLLQKEVGKDEAGKPILEDDEKPGDYAARVTKEKNIQVAQVNDALAKRGPIVLDLTPQPAKPKGKLADKYRAIAKDFLSGKADLKRFALATQKAGLGGFAPSGDNAADIEKLGWLCRAYQEAQDSFRGFKP